MHDLLVDMIVIYRSVFYILSNIPILNSSRWKATFFTFLPELTLVWNIIQKSDPKTIPQTIDHDPLNNIISNWRSNCLKAAQLGNKFSGPWDDEYSLGQVEAYNFIPGPLSAIWRDYRCQVHRLDFREEPCFRSNSQFEDSGRDKNHRE